MGRHKSLTPSKRHLSGSLYGQPDGCAHVRAARQSAASDSFVDGNSDSIPAPTHEKWQSLTSTSVFRNSHDPHKGDEYKYPRDRIINTMLLLHLRESAGASWGKNVPKLFLPPHPDCWSFIVSSRVFGIRRRALRSIVVSERMQLALWPCKVGVYLPVCGHPGFMAVIQ